jgi:hypothetical protein
VLAGGLALGAWWLLNPLLAALLAAATVKLGRWLWGDAEARAAALLLCASPFVVALAGSEMSHLGAAALGMAAAWAATGAGTRPTRAAIAAGALLGVVAAFRPLDAVAATVPVAAVLAMTATRSARAVLVAGASGALASLPTLWFNRATTGSWLEFGYTRLWGPQHALGFHDVPWGEALTPVRAVGLTGMDLHQLNAYLLDAPFPLLAAGAVGFVIGRRQLASRDAVPVLGASALFGLLFFYWHRDWFYGPRLHFAAAPWVVLLLARGALLLARAGGPRVGGQGAGAIVAFALGAGLLFGLVALMPDRLRAYRASTPLFDLHPDREARRAGLSNAVVVVPDGWGNRLIVRMWALGVPVWRSSRLYAAIDACTLELALGRAEADAAARMHLLATLDSLAALGRPGVRAALTDDANLRLPARAPTAASADSVLAPACLDEIATDRRGFLQFAPLLYHNTAVLDGDIVWARDLGPRNAALFARYAGRRFYRYGPPARGAPPAFTPIAAQ